MPGSRNFTGRNGWKCHAKYTGRRRRSRWNITSSSTGVIRIEERVKTSSFTSILAPDLKHAIHKIALLPIHFFRHEAVNVGLEAGQFLVEVARKLEIVDDGLVEDFARDQ